MNARPLPVLARLVGIAARRPWTAWGHGLFGTPLNAVITVACLAVLAWAVPPLLRWAVVDATWTGTAEACRQNGGACWAFIGEKLRFILFGFYPADRHWRPALVLLILCGLVVASGIPRLWHRRMVAVWVLALAGSVTLLAGQPSAALVSTDRWGGLPLTLLLSVVGMAGAFPLAILLALGRRSRMGLVRLFSVLFIEVLRGVPLIAVLYVASLLIPLMLPAGLDIDKLLRAQIAIVLFTAAYLAEIVRAGLQAVPSGQYEAAQSLGLGYWRAMRLVILPQALRTVIPSIVTLAIGVLHDTTLIIVIGLFDVLNTARSSASDPEWLGFFDESFGFVALLYVLLCSLASRYSLWLEARLAHPR